MPEVNQQLIAETLGLSRATVSRCFTNHAGISPKTRAKVFQLAAELGYSHQETRSPAAKLAKSAVKFSVLICSDKEEYYHGSYESPGAQILSGVSEFAQSVGASLDIDFFPPNCDGAEWQLKDVPSLADRRNRGVLLIYPFPEEVVSKLSIALPVVSLVDQSDRLDINCVDVDHYEGVSSVIDHLTQNGHHKIGFFTKAYPVEATWSFRRFGAFVEKMARLGRRVTRQQIYGVFSGAEVSIADSAEEIAKRIDAGVTAWVCAAD
ncbi:MAG: LacI family DNA-binding transcriptional regulator, partial [Verrucomicrobiota bacterium]